MGVERLAGLEIIFPCAIIDSIHLGQGIVTIKEVVGFT